MEKLIKSSIGAIIFALPIATTISCGNTSEVKTSLGTIQKNGESVYESRIEKDNSHTHLIISIIFEKNKQFSSQQISRPDSEVIANDLIKIIQKEKELNTSNNIDEIKVSVTIEETISFEDKIEFIIYIDFNASLNKEKLISMILEAKTKKSNADHSGHDHSGHNH